MVHDHTYINSIVTVILVSCIISSDYSRGFLQSRLVSLVVSRGALNASSPSLLPFRPWWLSVLSPFHTRTATLHLSRHHPKDLYVWTQMSCISCPGLNEPSSLVQSLGEPHVSIEQWTCWWHCTVWLLHVFSACLHNGFHSFIDHFFSCRPINISLHEAHFFNLRF